MEMNDNETAVLLPTEKPIPTNELFDEDLIVRDEDGTYTVQYDTQHRAWVQVDILEFQESKAAQTEFGCRVKRIGKEHSEYGIEWMTVCRADREPGQRGYILPIHAEENIYFARHAPSERDYRRAMASDTAEWEECEGVAIRPICYGEDPTYRQLGGTNKFTLTSRTWGDACAIPTVRYMIEVEMKFSDPEIEEDQDRIEQAIKDLAASIIATVR